MPMMQQRHYEFLAMEMAILNNRLMKEDCPEAIRDFFQKEFLPAMAHDLKQDNQNFKQDKFMDKCMAPP